jgi:histidyl-tRNA synthetase
VQRQLVDVPELPGSLNAATRAHHDEVCQHLTDLGVSWEDAPRLVRGLDYYTRTTFVFVHDGLGAQSAVGGGGRYDGLSESIGGPALPGVGWALGMERTILALQAEGLAPSTDPACTVFFVPQGDDARRTAVPLIAELRRAGIAADMAWDRRSFKAGVKAADRVGAILAVIIGERELADGTAQVKDLRSGEQTAVALPTLISTLLERTAL